MVVLVVEVVYSESDGFNLELIDIVLCQEASQLEAGTSLYTKAISWRWRQILRCATILLGASVIHLTGTVTAAIQHSDGYLKLL